jgi:inorganic pyrophosphatase
MLDGLFAKYKLVIDRPKNSKHPRYDFIYPLDYGYLEGTASSDGAGIDVWVGSDTQRGVVGIISSVDSIKADSEIKILYGCTPEEINLIYKYHNRTSGMKGLLNIRK